MATEIVDFKNLKSDNEDMISEKDIVNKINNLTDEDEDNDSVVLNMSDMSDLAEAMALVKAGLDRISEITRVDVSNEAVTDIIDSLS